MDTKEMRDRIKQKAAESVAAKQQPENRVHARRTRSYKSLIINLVALVGLFALVFVLQQVGKRHAEKAEPAEQATQVTKVTAAEVTIQESTAVPTAKAPAQKKAKEKIQNQEVAMVVMETTEEGAAQPKAQAKIILKTKKTKNIKAKAAARRRATTRSRSHYGQSWREDRVRSAELVDMLDGGGNKGNTYSTSRTYTTTTPRQRSNYTKYNAPSRSHSGRMDRRSSAELVDMLDGGGAQPATKRTKRLNWANEVPMATTRTTYRGIEETTLAPQGQTRGYATAAPQEKPTYIAPSRRPAWDANVGANAK